MNCLDFSFRGTSLKAMPSGALWWPDCSLLCVSDLHLGKSERAARRTGQPLPPYDTRDTLNRLIEDIAVSDARVVVCLGDSFDDLSAAENLAPEEHLRIVQMQAGRRWVWIEGNHDPGPLEISGEHMQQLVLGELTFRHIAGPMATGEISGHYHPKARLSTRGGTISRPAFLFDDKRLILPAYGTYTGGLKSSHSCLVELMSPRAMAILTGPSPTCIPMPR